MCGIIAVFRRPSDRAIPGTDEVLAPLAGAVALLGRGDPSLLAGVADVLEEVDHMLGGVPGLMALDSDPSLAGRIRAALAPVPDLVDTVADALGGSDHMEEDNAALVRVRDSLWAVVRDRLGSHSGVSTLRSTSPSPSDAGLAVLLSTQQALSAIDRLEVRGRDSAGLQVTV